MKRIIKLFAASIAAIVCATTVATAANPKSEIVTQCFVSDIECEGCVSKVMKTLPYQKGIKDVKCDIKTQEITVKYDTRKSSNEAVIAALKKVDVKAKPKVKE